MLNLVAYCDGSNSLLEIAEEIGRPMWDLLPIIQRLSAVGLLTTS
jgi:aminopeptidase-like protein